MFATSPWRVEVLGAPRLLGPDAEAVPLDRKTSALFAYLALEGPTSRAKLASLLWPDSQEGTARNNLAQTLRKLRLASREDLIVGRAEVRLAEGVLVDAPTVRDLYRQGRYEAFAAGYTELLEHFDYDDCPDLEEWLLGERERWQQWQRTALRALTLDAEAANDLEGALTWAQQLLGADPASEETFALVMRLQFALGDRTRALETLRACEDMLAREYSVTPAEGTLALARLIREGTLPSADRSSRNRQIPLSVLRPPVLVGREREWALMEEAWAKGQGVCLVGEAGVGKSRLVQEFARAHGGDFYFECRPGDEGALYGTTVRMLRKVLRRYPQLSFEPWVTQQLALILPEFGTPPAPLTTEADKVRFYQALTEVVRAAIGAGMTVLAYDDTHHFDDASAEAQLFLWGALGWGDVDAPFRIVFNSRPQEYTSLAAQALRDLVQTGRVLVLELGPLAPDAVKRLVTSMNVPNLEALTPALQRYTGGNPQFLLETVKHLIETGQAERGFPERLPPPEPVGAVVTQRLARLSPTALHTARSAAVLQSDFTLELVSEVLRSPLLEVLPAWQELERAQMIAEGRFSHDLVYEAVEAYMPDGVRAALHRSAARVLEGHRSPPARIAQHWLRGGEPLRAVPKLREAAEQARTTLRFVEAANLYEQVTSLLEAHGDVDAAFGARLLLTRDFVKEFDLGERYEASLSRLFALAHTEGQRAQAWHCKGLLHSRRSELSLAWEAAREGWTHAERSEDLAVQAELSQLLGIVSLQLGQLEEAATALRRAATLNERLGRVTGQLSALQNLGVVLAKLGRYADAARHFEALALQGERAERPVIQAHALTNLALALSRLGRKREAHVQATRAYTLVERMQGRAMNRVMLLVVQGELARDLGQYTAALEVLERAREVSEAYGHFAGSLVLRQTASVYAALGALDRAEELAQAALRFPKASPPEQADALTLLARLDADRGGSASVALDELDPLLAHLSPEEVLKADVVRLQAALHPDLAESERVLGCLRDLEARDLLIVAEVQHARSLVRAGRAGDALQHSFAAVRMLETYDALEWPRDRILALHAAVLDAAHHPEAREAARRAAEAAYETATSRVPVDYRQTYLTLVLGELPGRMLDQGRMF